MTKVFFTHPDCLENAQGLLMSEFCYTIYSLGPSINDVSNWEGGRDQKLVKICRRIKVSRSRNKIFPKNERTNLFFYPDSPENT